MKIKIQNNTPWELPSYAKPGDSGMDLRANINEAIILDPLERKLIPSGIRLDIPEGYEVQIRPRSGMALKKGLSVLNTPGTIDANYTGEIGIIAVNLSREAVTIEPGERVAQMVCIKVEKIELEEAPEITKETERGAGGYGSTGTK